jgi:hypothetical protein
MARQEKPPTETQMLSALKSGRVLFPPLKFEGLEQNIQAKDIEIDAVVRLRWNRKAFRFAVECKVSSFPKAIEAAVENAKKAAMSYRQNANPLVLVPFLTNEQLAYLENAEVSGMDLCGNGIIIVPDELLILRSGRPNRFIREGEIKNVYRGMSSIVARMFLLQPEFASIGDVRKQVLNRGGTITLATVSKVVKALDADLIVQRKKNRDGRRKGLRLIQPEKLLERLTLNFTRPRVETAISGKLRIPFEQFAEWSKQWEKSTNERVSRTGSDSVQAYAVMAREPVRTLYCTDLRILTDALADQFRPAERFADIVIQETNDDTVYFDRQPNLVASPVQTYLELMSGDKRDQETADQLRRLLLSRLSRCGNVPATTESP